MTFPEYYLDNAVGAQMVSNGRRNPLIGSNRLPGVQIMLLDGSQRVMTYATPVEAREAAYRFAEAAMLRQGKVPA